jgi:hypothetical protein
MINEEDILSDEELLKITGGDTFASNISVISNPTIIRMLYGIQPLYGIKPLYGIRPLNTID